VTQDGGQSWNDITPPRLARNLYTKVYFLNARSGWVAGRSRGLPRNVSVFRTDDGGESWRRSAIRGSIPDPATPGPPSLFFTDAKHGWDHQDTGSHSGFYKGIIFRTTDGGRSWRALDVPYPAGGIGLPDEFMFVDAQRGWLPATEGLYATTDGGSAWSKQSARPPGARPGSIQYASAPVAAGKSLILPVAFRQRGKVRYSEAFFVSPDLGATWELAGSTPDSFRCRNVPYEVEVLGRGSWIVMCDSELIRTTNSGHTWSALDGNGLPADFFATSLSFADLRHGWIAANYSGCRSFKSDCYKIRELYATSDGGDTWKRELAH
jgi:photosystem II stability/assembly factor-like uncharacterized protein